MCAQVSRDVSLLSFFLFFIYHHINHIEKCSREVASVRLSGRDGEIRSTVVGLSVTLTGAMCGSLEFNNLA